MFCPQCGNATGTSAVQGDSHRAQEDPVDTQKHQQMPTTTEATDDEVADATGRDQAPAPEVAAHSSLAGNVASQPRRESRARVQQAKTAAPGALEGRVWPRMDKVRRASSIMLEEAAYDPSIRFILVAAVLFVLFLVLLLLSKWLG